MTIQQDLKKAEELVIKGSEQAIRGVALKLFTDIVDGTRVDTGRLKGNVQVTLGSQAEEELDIEDKSGAKAKRSGNSVIGDYTLADTIFITNKLPYARVMEDGNNKVQGDKVWKSTVSLFGQELEKQSKLHRIK